mmetsp:Transcript_2283/g.8956  ORF Transcript_2283/g.8956 Transcript_2283/m.8956 type:complete len:251 (-) Transcript_2283:36-788(-)
MAATAKAWSKECSACRIKCCVSSFHSKPSYQKASNGSHSSTRTTSEKQRCWAHLSIACWLCNRRQAPTARPSSCAMSSGPEMASGPTSTSSAGATRSAPMATPACSSAVTSGSPTRPRPQSGNSQAWSEAATGPGDSVGTAAAPAPRRAEAVRRGTAECNFSQRPSSSLMLAQSSSAEPAWPCFTTKAACRAHEGRQRPWKRRKSEACDCFWSRMRRTTASRISTRAKRTASAAVEPATRRLNSKASSTS